MTKHFNPAALLLLFVFWASGILPAQVLWYRDFNPAFTRYLGDAKIGHGGNVQFLQAWYSDSDLYTLDAAGNITDSLAVPGGAFVSFDLTQDKGMAFYGLPNTTATGETLIKMDSNETVVWQSSFITTDVVNPIRVIGLSDGGFVTLAEMSNGMSSDIRIRRYSSNGVMQWTQDKGHFLDDWYPEMALFPNEDILLVSGHNYQTEGGFQLERIDGSGQSVWVTIYSKPLNYAFTAMPLTLPDGGLILICNYYNTVTLNSSSIVRYDSAGVMLWEKEIVNLGWGNGDMSLPIHDKKGGYSVAIATEQSFGNTHNTDIALFHMDTLGNPLSIHRIGHPQNETPDDLIQMQDSNYVVIGGSSSFNPQATTEVYAAKVGHDGCDREYYIPPFPQFNYWCDQNPKVLDAGAGFVQYLWSTGDTGRYFTVITPDTFHVQAIDTNGCVYTSWITLATQPEPLPQLSYTVNGLTVNFASNNIGLWTFGDGTSLFANDPIYTYAAPGTYWVCIQYEGAFCDSVIRCDSVQVGLASTDNPPSGFEIFPNPANDKITVKAGEGTAFECELWDATGRLLKKQSGLGLLQLDLQEWPVGIYTLRILPSDGRPAVCKSVVLQR